MPDSPKLQRQKWITLPQALRWIVTREVPTPENMGVLPSFPDGDSSRENLFRYWIEGSLKLYGSSESNSIQGRLPYRSYEDDCEETYGFRATIPAEIIKKSGFNSINWCHCTIGYYYIEDNPPDLYCYWVNLRVRWDDFYALTTGREISRPEKKSHVSLHKKRSSAPSKGQRGKKPRKDWPLLAALSVIVGERNPDFWAVGTDDKLEILGPILAAGDHLSPNNNILPGRSQFDKIALSYVKVANELVAEQRSPDLPLLPDTLPLVAALVAIIREHDREPGEVSCESKMTEQVELLLNAAADVEGSSFFGSSDTDLYKKAQAATKHASEVHKRFCRKPRLGPI